MSDRTNRRGFLALLTAGLAVVWSGALAALSAVFVTTPLRRGNGQTEVAVGKTSDFGTSYTPVPVKFPIEDGWHTHEVQRLIFVRVDDEGNPNILSATCPHLGCSVRWEEEHTEFRCPCHGGRFAADGALLGGPPPRGLATMSGSIRDGQVFVAISA